MAKDKVAVSHSQGVERYLEFIHNSTEGIWCCELEKPMSIKLSVDAQIKHIYKHAYMAETNLANAKMYGYRSTKPLIGMRLGELLIETDPENRAYLEAFIKNGYKLSGAESHELDKNGKPKYFLNSLVGIIEDGHVTRAWGTQQDVTEQKLANNALLRREERLNMALEASSIGLWEWDVASNTLYWSSELRKIFGVKPDETMTYEKYVNMIHPEDQELANKMAYHSMQTGETYQFEHRIIRRDGKVSWLLGMGRAYLENGKPVRMIGTSANINPLKEAQELSKANLELKTERAELMALNNAKDEFIALASHQLRTPATAVKQYISLLISEAAGPISGEQLQYLQIAFNSNERQLRIINDLLKTAQIDSTLYVLDKHKHDVAEVIRFAIEELRSTFDLKEQQVIVKGTQSIKANIDVTEMKLVLVNLLENASKYSHEDSQIVVSLKKMGKEFELSIADKGVGIRQRDMDRIFEKFTRIDNELSDTVTGTGLGLYWVKRIIDLHNGSIKIESTLGKGTVFTLRLPV